MIETNEFSRNDNNIRHDTKTTLDEVDTEGH